jgi:hypothetical protein
MLPRRALVWISFVFVATWAGDFGQLSAAQIPGAQTPAAQIPPLHGTAFSGAQIDLPEALQGKIGILMFGFSHASSEAVSGWGKRVAADYRDSPTITYLQLPVLASAPKFMHGVITRSIKSGVPQQEWPHFVPILDNEHAWRAVAHYGKPDDAYLVVVDGIGHVLWHFEGPATDTSYAALKQQVAARSPAH